MMPDLLDNPFHAILNEAPPLVLDPNRTALLVVDMQYFDASPDWGEGRTAKELGVLHCFDPYFAQIDDIIPRIQRLLALFRGKEMEVMHLRVAEWTEDSRDVGWKQLVRGLIVPSNSREADLLEPVAPIGDEIVVSKSSSGVFPVTNIDRLLRNLNIQTLIFTGTATGGCVESAVRDAVDLGYDVVVVADACADSTADSHALALSRMAGGLTRILTTSEIENAVSTLPDGSRRVRSGLERVKPYLPEQPTIAPGPDANPYAIIFPPAVQLAVGPANTALTLIDAQRFTCDPSWGLGQMAAQRNQLAALAGYYERVQAALDRMADLLAACRRLGYPVIHVRTAGQLRDGRDLSRHLRVQGIRIWQDGPEAEFMPPVAPLPGELIVNKPAAGVFTGAGFDELLRNLGLEHLILAGVSFGGALENSLRSATDRGYGAILVPDACATYHAVLQEKLYGMQSGIIQVKETTAAIAHLEAQSALWRRGAETEAERTLAA
jgi:nicotinamidase-related amidase